MYHYEYGRLAASTALGIKTGGIAERPYMRETAEGTEAAAKGLSDKVLPHMTMRNMAYYGLPAAYGAVEGAEGVPNSKVLGALLGAGAAMGGSHLGGGTARALEMEGGLIAEPLLRYIGANAGVGLSNRAGRLITEEGA